MSLYDKWHKYSKTGQLDTAGCQILADWKREADQLRSQLSTSQAEVGRLREVLKKLQEFWWSDKGEDYEQAEVVIRETLSASSPAADRWKAMERVVEAVNDCRNAEEELADAVAEERHALIGLKFDARKEARKRLDDALSALEKEGGGK